MASIFDDPGVANSREWSRPNTDKTSATPGRFRAHEAGETTARAADTVAVAGSQTATPLPREIAQAGVAPPRQAYRTPVTAPNVINPEERAD